MRHMKRFAQAALAAAALTACIGAGTASATTVEIGGVTRNEPISITASLNGNTSLVLRDTFGFSANTCSGSHVERETESPYTSTKVTGANQSVLFTGCSAPVTVQNPGKLYVEHITETTNGRVYAEEAEVTVWSGLHGTYINCTTGEGTLIGTTTGVKEGHATLDLNATLTCAPHLHSSRWTGEYIVTSPTGFGISA